MIANVLTTILGVQLALLAWGGRLARVLDRRLLARPGQGTIEWVFITASIAVGLAAVMTLLNGALNEYFTALVDWLRTHKPV